jgi:tetratricopeptide (TPR) repeat protein
MSNGKTRPSDSQSRATSSAAAASPPPPPARPGSAPDRPAPLFRTVDWMTMGITTLLVLVGYVLTLAPDVTLEDSGELAVASFYAGVPHPPGYPVWTIYTWLFANFVPIANVAWRVALGSAVASALSCGLLALMVSRGSSMMVEGIEGLKDLERRLENAICVVAGVVAGMLMGFNGFMWSQSVIVEVYTFGVLSLMGVLCCVMRWLYRPDQKRYLYWAMFLFGICFTNHQTLVVAAMGLELAILARAPKLGRDLFLANGVVYLGGLVLKANGILTSFDNNPPLFMVYNGIGLGSIAIGGWMAMKTGSAFSEWKTVLLMGGLWAVGSAFYFYMPIAGMTNPPLNWGYPRTWGGFLHALSRGQYERANPTNLFQDPGRFVMQLWLYGEGVVDEFNPVYLLIAVVPFLFLRQMQKRERAWMAGLGGVFFCLAIILLILLNPSPDRQSKELNRVFFTASHVMIAMWIGHGLALIAAHVRLYYAQWRIWGLYGGAVAAALALFGYAHLESLDRVARFTALFGLAWALAAILLFALFRSRPRMGLLLAGFAVMPVHSITSHWADNEQRGHLFGYWFGHDMFTPPFADKSGAPLYPEMARNAVLFGGTDPGRFNPTYMIFCESFIPPSKKPRDPKFDRRDVYLITQNALADGTYLDYIRAHYNRSAQNDPHFFQEMLRSRADIQANETNLLARMFLPVDKLFTGIGARIEASRRARGVYPPKEIITPTPEDSARCYEEYVLDAQRRMQLGQLKPGEDVRAVGGKLQVTGQVAVMAINGLLTKIIFDKNPDHEFYVEESFPLDWMYPYLEPYGVIMRINRTPLAALNEEQLQRDHEFWRQYSKRLVGDWVTYDTTVKEICEFAERVYLHRDLRGYKGDPAFIRDDNAQKSFSKLRGSIAKLYKWRINQSKSREEQLRLIKEADFAFRQAVAFCPFSPEAAFYYVDLLATPGIDRLDDALLIAETCYKFDKDNASIKGLVDQIKAVRANQAAIAPLQQQIAQSEAQFATNRTNVQLAFNLASAYLQLQRSNQAFQVLDQLVANPASDAGTLLSVAKAFADLGQAPRLEATLRRIVQVMPQNPDIWLDLAGTEAFLGKTNEAVQTLSVALALSDQRRAIQTNAEDLRVKAAKDPRFAPLQGMRVLPEAAAPAR